MTIEQFADSEIDNVDRLLVAAAKLFESRNERIAGTFPYSLFGRTLLEDVVRSMRASLQCWPRPLGRS